jgi:cell division protease FtsH
MSVARTQNVSEATAQKIDSEIRRLVEAGYSEATQILTDRKDDLEALAQGLLEYETLSGDEIHDLLKGKPPVRDSGDGSSGRTSAAVPSSGKGRPRQEPDAGMEPQPLA